MTALALLIALCADLEVTVIDDASGRPLRNARVTAMSEPGGVTALETGANGRVKFTGWNEGAHRVTIARDSYNTLITEASKSIAVRLIRLGVITGVVSGAQAHTSVLAIKFGRVVSAAKTDSQGRYRLFDLPPGQYTIARAGDGIPQFHRLPLTITGSNEYPGIDFLPAAEIEGQSITGQVTHGGAPIRSQLSLVTTTPPYITVSRRQTDEAGRYRFESVPTGTYEVLASAFATAPLYGRTAIDVGTTPAQANITVGEASKPASRSRLILRNVQSAELS